MWNLITLDGYFEGETPWDLPWHEAAWGEELEQFSREQLAAADMLVFGRVTYEGMAAYWTTATGAIADAMNSLPKLVCSRTLSSASWNNSKLLRDNVAVEIQRLKQAGDGDLYVFGSGNLSETLINAGLFDEYRIAIAPVIQGRGRLLFPEGLHKQGLKLQDARSLKTGCVILCYGNDRTA